ncbi:hypothetical protein VNO78_16133 [Psophocarpus tetragonolobus]|uniref:TF-B3 domain-containing protein n=1 Tax=Psophocarpus tetragonolobus TaxID=3891 RepID=A0AAN9SGL8_PSOTE
MTSKLNQGDDYHGHSASNPIHFFKIMLHSNLLQGNLKLPTKFVKKYGKDLPKTMLLRLPNGAKWKVNLEKCKRKMEESLIPNYGAHEAAKNSSFAVIIKPRHLTKSDMYLSKYLPNEFYIKPGEQYVTLLVGEKS